MSLIKPCKGKTERTGSTRLFVPYGQSRHDPIQYTGRVPATTQSGWYQPRGRIYGVTLVDHANGIVANGSVLGREFSAGVFNELFPTSRKETLHTAEQHAERQYEQRSRTANPVSGVVDTLLDLVDARAFEEQQRIQRRRRKRKLHR